MIKTQKRIGRGQGSGRGKTSGRGTKGQKARGNVPSTFTGSNLPLYKTLPKRKGLGNRSVSDKPKILSLSDLSDFKGIEVTLESLMEQKIISEKDHARGVKILGAGELKSKLTIKVPVSKSVKATVEKAGGKVDA